MQLPSQDLEKDDEGKKNADRDPVDEAIKPGQGSIYLGNQPPEVFTKKTYTASGLKCNH